MAPTHFLFGLLAAFAPRALASCGHGTHIHPRATSGEITAPKFTYYGAKGPVNWHSIDTANGFCANGTHQSPINMVSDVFTVVPGSELSVTIPDWEEGAEFENLGSTVEVVAESGTIKVGDVEYSLKQFHFHLPSEHLDDGVSTAMEMHMVWQSAATKIAVIGIFVEIAEEEKCETVKTEASKTSSAAATSSSACASSRVRGRKTNSVRALESLEERTTYAKGSPSTLLETVLGSVNKIPHLGETLTTPALKMSEIVDLVTAGSFHSYSGSLTTPPCTEGVSWFVSTEKLAIKASTFAKARDVIGFNSRFPQNTPGETNVIKLAAKSL